MNNALGQSTFWIGLLVVAFGLGIRWITTMGVWKGNETFRVMIP